MYRDDVRLEAFQVRWRLHRDWTLSGWLAGLDAMGALWRQRASRVEGVE